MVARTASSMVHEMEVQGPDPPDQHSNQPFHHTYLQGMQTDDHIVHKSLVLQVVDVFD